MAPYNSPREWSRRSFFTALAAASLRASTRSGKGESFPSDAHRYLDAATEFPVVRLTSPTYASYLTASYNRGITEHNALLYASDRTGSLQVFRMALHDGSSRQLTAAANLDPSTVSLVRGDRSFCYFDDRTLVHSNLSGRDHEVYRLPEGTSRGKGFSLAPDGARGFFIERSAGRYRLQDVSLRKGEVSTLAESTDELSDPIACPGRSHVLYRRDGGSTLWLAHYDGRESQAMHVAPGRTGPVYWSPDGRSFLYLNLPEDRKQLNNIREFVPDTGEDKLIGKTSQFVAFSCNSDFTVFVGASGSKASPYILILLRSPHRELTLCEDRTSDPARADPVFTPNSQRIVFASDQHGKPAIYMLQVNKFVDETSP
jgi:oligogalacturonide lyase